MRQAGALAMILAWVACSPAATPTTRAPVSAEPSSATTPPAPPAVAASSAVTDPCDTETTTVAMEGCVTERRHQIEAEIQATLERLTRALGARGVGDADAVVATSQSDWERYRASHCNLFERLSEGGSLARIAVAYCRRDLAQARLSALQSLEQSVVQ